MYLDTSGAFNQDLDRAVDKLVRNRVYPAEKIYNFFSIDFTIKPPINARIAMYHYLMSNRRFYLTKECVHLTRELTQSLYKETQRSNSMGKVERMINREDENDHLINASEYAFSRHF